MSRHVCLVTPELRGVTAGGIGVAVADLATAFADRGDDVTVLLTGLGGRALLDTPTSVPPDLATRVRVVSADDRSLDVRGADMPDWAFGHELWAISYRTAFALEALARATPFDLVEFPDYQGSGWFALSRRRLLGGPLEAAVVTVRLHGTLEVCMEQELAPRNTHVNRLSFALERGALHLADHVVAASSAVGAWYATRYDLDPRRLHTSPLPYRPLPVVARPLVAGPDTGRRTVGFVGKIQRLKGADRLVEAAVLLCEREPERDLRFVLAGGDTLDARSGGSLLATLQRRVPERWRDRIVFAGLLPRPELAAMASGCDLLVFPNRVETYCLAAYELLDTGLPYLLSDIPAFDEVQAERNRRGLATRRFSGEGEALADAIEAALDLERGSAVAPGSPVDPVAAYDGLRRATAPAPHPVAGTRVSVVVPFYEMQDHVDATLASIFASTHADLEVIVVDDGTPSDAGRAKVAALEALATREPRLRVVRKANGGLGSARNAGIAVASGAFVLPVDSDDLVHPRMIETMVAAFARAPELSAVSCYVSFFEDESTLAPVDYVVPYELDPVLVTLENRAGVASSMFRRAVFDSLRYDELAWAFEDWSLWWSLAAAGAESAVIPEILFHYRRRPGSMVRTVSNEAWARLLEHVADEHAGALAANAVDVYTLVMSSFVAARAELHHLRDENAGLRARLADITAPADPGVTTGPRPRPATDGPGKALGSGVRRAISGRRRRAR